MKEPNPIEQYIAQYEGETRIRLIQIQELLASVFPDAEQLIRYKMPTFRVGNKDVIYFAAYKKHISLMPTPYTIEHFARHLTDYKTTNHAIQFQNEQPLPSSLIKEIALWNKKALEEGTLYGSSV
jgi:uncharacterized protein YdhG (YjbR/CyaY superfamily)